MENVKGNFFRDYGFTSGLCTGYYRKYQEVFLDSLIDFIQNVFSGNWSGAWQSILDILDGIWSGITGIFKAPLNAIVDAWNSLVGSIGSIEVPEWGLMNWRR